MADPSSVVTADAASSSEPPVTGGWQPRSLRGRVPALGAAQAEALRQLFSRQICWSLSGERVLTLGMARQGPKQGGVFELEGDGQRMALRFDPGSAAISSSPHWSDYQGRARLLAWSLDYEPLLMQLSEAIGIALLPMQEAPAQDIDHDDGQSLWLAFAIEDMYEAVDDNPPFHQSGTIRLPAHWLTGMLARSEPIDPDNPQPDLTPWLQLPAQAWLCCPGPTLSAQAWSELAPGDVAVLGKRSALPQMFVKLNGRQWPVSAHADGWKIDADIQIIPTLLENFAMNQNEPAAPAEETPGVLASDAATRNLPVLLEFELGRLELSMGEIAGLQPGYVFALPSFVEGANVILRANGRVSGRGEIVSVGDTLGVRLVSWS